MKMLLFTKSWAISFLSVLEDNKYVDELFDLQIDHGKHGGVKKGGNWFMRWYQSSISTILSIWLGYAI